MLVVVQDICTLIPATLYTAGVVGDLECFPPISPFDLWENGVN